MHNNDVDCAIKAGMTRRDEIDCRAAFNETFRAEHLSTPCTTVYTSRLKNIEALVATRGRDAFSISS